MQCIIIWSLSLVCVVLNVLRRISTFWIVWCQIDAIHCNLITFVVLRRNSKVLDRFDVKSMQCTIILSLSSFSDKTQKFWSFRRQIDAMHYNLITFVGLRCFECFATYLNILDCFDVKSMQSIVIWLLL